MYGFKHQFCADDTCILLVQQSNGVYTVGDFMTRKENLHDEEGESTYRLRARLQLCEHISKEA